MKKLSILFLAIGCLGIINSQAPLAVPTYDFTYYVQGEGGANGLTVTYNPTNQYYYCIQAGNAGYPLEVFNSTGMSLYTTNAKNDTRGFWYNAKLKCFEGTMYTGGTFKMYLDGSGFPSYAEFPKNSSAFVPPNEQTQTVCNVAKSEMYLYSYADNAIFVYNQKNNKLKKKLSIKNCPTGWENINPYAIIYTGHKNYEFGLYDFVNYRILFFNSKAEYTSSCEMSLDAPYTEVFRVSFANDRVFLYDGDLRSWTAYKLF